MYVRETRIRRGDKVYTYYQLVEGYRVDGKVRQRVVSHLGAWLDRRTARVVAKMHGLMCGEWECGRRGTQDRGVTEANDFGKDPARVLLCEEHACELGSGETLTAVALR